MQLALTPGGLSGLLRPTSVVAASLAAATLGVATLERLVGVTNASSAYLLAVVAAAALAGTAAAVSVAAGAFLLYDYLFVEPVHTLSVTDPAEWLNLLLLLFVGIVVARLAAVQRDRAEAAALREREAIAMFRISYTLALAPSTDAALTEIVGILAGETAFARVWVALGSDDAIERPVTDSDPSAVLPPASVVSILRRRPGDQPAEWTLVHTGAGHARRATGRTIRHRVPVEASGRRLGSIWAERPLAAGAPGREETRLISAAADQIGRALERDRLAADVVNAEVARRSDALKTALLDSVSHNLRTPLASIRAAAGSLADPEVPFAPDEMRAIAVAIDRDAERLASLVTNLLDLGRIEGGALRPERHPFVIGDLVADSLDRYRSTLGGRALSLDVPADLPLVLVDPLLVDQALANLFENAARHTAPDAPIRIAARYRPGTAHVTLTVEDGGAGVPPAALPRLFERFFRVPGGRSGSRSGTGIGLAVVHGLVEATGGTASARPSTLGGLAIDLDLPLAAPSSADAAALERAAG